MIPKIETETFLEPLNIGSSKPIKVICSDEKTYILKKEKGRLNGQIRTFNCSFVNESLGYYLAEFLDIPVPKIAAINLDPIIYAQYPDALFKSGFTPGLYFGCEEIKPLYNNILDNYEELMLNNKPYIKRSWNSIFKNAINKDDIAKIFSFDFLVNNTDRYNNIGNILIQGNIKYNKLFAIDHGHAFFGPIWNNNLQNIILTSENCITYINTFITSLIYQNQNINGQINLNGMGEVFNTLQMQLNIEDLTNHPFKEIIFKIENITEDNLEYCLNNIPNEWYINKELQINHYKHLILNRKNFVRYFIQELYNRNAFTNSVGGGTLSWKENQYGTV